MPSYEGGAWDVTPDTSENAITEDVTYVYTFRPADPDVSESAVVTFRVVNGTWADCSSADQTVEIALTDGHGTLASTQVPTGMKPDAWLMKAAHGTLRRTPPKMPLPKT